MRKGRCGEESWALFSPKAVFTQFLTVGRKAEEEQWEMNSTVAR